MHLPDGFLSDPVCAATATATAAGLAAAIVGLRRQAGAPSGAMMAATGAAIFAAQMINFPVDHGVSGHLLGSAIAAALLGPWAGMLTMAMVVAVQCAVFGDGGASALGANLLNMAVIGVLVASGLRAAALRALPGERGQLVAGGLAAVGSVMAAAVACSLELALSGAYAFQDVLGAMARVHAPIALAEGLMTAAALAAIAALAGGSKKAGRLIELRLPRISAEGRVACAGLLLAVGLVTLLGPAASTAPDGLERVAADLGFADLARGGSFPVLALDYQAPGVPWEPAAIALAGMLGVMVVFASTWTMSRAALAKRAVPKNPGR